MLFRSSWLPLAVALLLPLQLLAAEVRISTNVGDFVVELNEEAAPITTANFLDYVDRGAYDNTIFHRVIIGFMIQGGGFYQDMTEAPDGETIHNEADNGLQNKRGTIAMARFGEIDSASRQFFINLSDNDHLDHTEVSCTREDEAKMAAASARGLRKPQTCETFGYAVFGKVIDGMDVVDEIEFAETEFVEDFEDVPITPIVILSTERVSQEGTDS